MHKNYMRSLPREWRAMAKVFVALGDEHRQRLLLTFEKGERLTVGQISQISTLSRPAVSHHLARLRRAGLVESRIEGRARRYVWALNPHGSCEASVQELLRARFDPARAPALQRRRPVRSPVEVHLL